MAGQKQFDEQDVLDKAVHAFWSRGYKATSMQTLVDCMGINRASLYATFGGKRELFLRSLRSYSKTFCSTQLAALERTASPKEAIGGLFAHWIAQAQDDTSPRGCLLNNTAVELADEDAEINRIVVDFQCRIEFFLRAKVIEGQALGEIRKELDPNATAARLLACLLGLLVLARNRREPEVLKGVLKETMASIT